ncbi:MAG TPA: transcriptional regulator [Methanomicrobia archaeon]|nr:transcriptional regulator [Methanomicrobia archaeon]
MNQLEDQLVMDAHVLVHPMRFRIVELLREKTMHINSISKALGEERRLVSYHLQILETYGFLSSKYEISEQDKSKGKAIRKFWVTDRVDAVLAELREKL